MAGPGCSRRAALRGHDGLGPPRPLSSRNGSPAKDPPRIIRRKGTGKPIEALALSEAGEWLAIAEGDIDGPWIARYSVATGQPFARWLADTVAVLRSAFGPGGTWLASGTGEGTVKIWRAPDGALPQILEGHTEAILALKLSPDGRTLSGGEARVERWLL